LFPGDVQGTHRQNIRLLQEANKTISTELGGLGQVADEFHDGTIEAYSNGPWSGSEFIVWLPHSDRNDIDIVRS
jgi:hypothetical protein